MNFFALVFVIAQAAVYQSYAQYLRPAPYLPNLLPGPVIAPSPCGCGQPILPPVCAPQTVLAPPTVIAPQTVLAGPSPLVNSLGQVVVQPNSVANNLVDTLSLLTVSSLLSECLPLQNTVALPYSPYYGGLNYYI